MAHMFEGKTKAALRLLCNQSRGGVLQLNEEVDDGRSRHRVRDILMDKHPPNQAVQPDAVINDEPCTRCTPSTF